MTITTAWKGPLTALILGALVLGAAVWINYDSSGGRVDQMVRHLMLDRAENDKQIANMFVLTRACKTQMPVAMAKVLNKYIAARGEDIKPKIGEARELLSNPFAMLLGCRAIQGMIDSYDF